MGRVDPVDQRADRLHDAVRELRRVRVGIPGLVGCCDGRIALDRDDGAVHAQVGPARECVRARSSPLVSSAAP